MWHLAYQHSSCPRTPTPTLTGRSYLIKSQPSDTLLPSSTPQLDFPLHLWSRLWTVFKYNIAAHFFFKAYLSNPSGFLMCTQRLGYEEHLFLSRTHFGFKTENGIWSLPEISSREYLRFKLFHLHSPNPSTYYSVFIPDDRLVSWRWFFSRVPPWYFLSSTSPKSSPAKETIAQRVSFFFSSYNHGLWLKHKVDENLLFEFHSAFQLQGWLSQEEKELQQALKLSQPTARSPLFLNQVTSPLLIISLLNPFSSQGRKGHSLSVTDQGKRLVVCGGYDTRTSCISWWHGQEGWTHFHTLKWDSSLNFSNHSHVSNQERSYPKVI